MAKALPIVVLLVGVLFKRPLLGVGAALAVYMVQQGKAPNVPATPPKA